MDTVRLHVARAATFREPAGEVWARIGNFDDVAWMPGVARVDNVVPGRVREVSLEGSESSVTEELLSATEQSHTFRFNDSGALPVKDYLAVLHVHDDGNTSTVTWTAEFSALNMSDEAAENQMAGWYEACLTNAGGVLLPPLSLHVFVSDYKALSATVPEWDSTKGATWPASTATLIAGDTEAVLIDALITVEESAELAAWIKAKGKNLTTIYVTHGHADHFFGTHSILREFPDAQVVALPEILPFADGQLDPGYVSYWESLFPGQLPEDLVGPKVPTGGTITLEGHELRPVLVGQSDTDPSSVVYVRDLDAVVGGDVVYNGIHLWLAQTGQEERDGWNRAIDIVESLAPAWAVAGHRDPLALSDAAPSLIESTRAYLRDFEEGVAASATTAELVSFMLGRYPAWGNPYTLTASSAAQYAKE
ncbi:MBL fold metallo-hydrolase [Herbiconiux solani]|uniref:MBL fold metallo-hydrolase n=1 Tax=Herbiconiux solani TaxID=661329 RepID=UPI000A036D5D|nr:MBL fold metallo-hydrolase [Herbiconiux solani]